jgi:hypothetical protein
MALNRKKTLLPLAAFAGLIVASQPISAGWGCMYTNDVCIPGGYDDATSWCWDSYYGWEGNSSAYGQNPDAPYDGRCYCPFITSEPWKCGIS